MGSIASKQLVKETLGLYLDIVYNHTSTEFLHLKIWLLKERLLYIEIGTM